MATTDTLSYSIELALLFPGWGYLKLPYLTAAFPRLSRLRGTLSLRIFPGVPCLIWNRIWRRIGH